MVAVGAVALLAGLLFLGGLLFLPPPRDDGLDWVRKFKPRQTQDDAIGTKGERIDFRVFTFKSVPPELLEAVRRRIGRYDINSNGNYSGSTKDGFHVYFSSKAKLLFATREPSWLEQRWMDVKAKLGWK